MSNKRLLLLSNSTMPSEQYFAWGKEHVKEFLSGIDEVLFIPYAGVTFSFDQYEAITQRAFSQMEIGLKSIHHSENPIDAVNNAKAIVIGGGNTFHLNYHLHQNNLVDAIREKVNAGIPYVGWSAGSNVACPTIQTTNDMPIIEPPTFDAINLVPFQINAHYTEKTIEGHGGESRDQRLLEFVEVNRGVKVYGLEEGSLLQIENDSLKLKGKKAKVFEYGKEPEWLKGGTTIN